MTGLTDTQRQVLEQQRARYFLLTAVTAFVALCWGAGLALYNGYPEFLWFFLAPLAVSLISPVYVRLGGQALLAEHLLLISTLSCVLGLGLYTGGRATGTLFWSVFIPALAVVMTGWRSGAFYGLVSFLVLMAIFFINLWEVPVPAVLSTDYSVRDVLVNGPFAVVAITILAGGVQARLEATRLELAQRQQAELMGKLTGSVAHDFNNLLGVIVGNLDVLESRVDKPDDAELIDDIRAAALSGSGMIRGLQTLSQQRPLKSQSVAVGPRLKNQLILLQRTLAKNGIQLKFTDSSHGASAALDPSQLDSAVMNLCLNARDAMPGGGDIGISVRAPSARWVEVCVNDNGEGMAPDVAQQALEPFFTTKDSAAGTGLGLSMVQAFVDSSGGSISIESTPDLGTRVRLRLPRLAEPGPDPEPEASPAASGKGRILAVEDDPALRKVIAQLLDSLGYEATTAENAAAAQRVLTGGQNFELVITDWVMPGSLDGLALAGWIRDRFPGQPVMIATGYAEDADARGRDFPLLRKPYTRAELARRIEAILPETLSSRN